MLGPSFLFYLVIVRAAFALERSSIPDTNFLPTDPHTPDVTGSVNTGKQNNEYGCQNCIQSIETVDDDPSEGYYSDKRKSINDTRISSRNKALRVSGDYPTNVAVKGLDNVTLRSSQDRKEFTEENQKDSERNDNENKLQLLIRKKREGTKEVTDGSDDEGDDNDDDGEEEEEKEEELPKPEGLAWIDPVRLANSGVPVENVPSLANLLGLRVFRYKTPPPNIHASRFDNSAPPHIPYRHHPNAGPPRINQPPNSPRRPQTNQRPSYHLNRYEDDTNLFGESFHNSFDNYFKELNSINPDILSSNSHNQNQNNRANNMHPLSNNRALRRQHMPPNLINHGQRHPPHPPSISQRQQNYHSTLPYPQLGGNSILSYLNPFNFFNRKFQPPYNQQPVPPPNYDPRRPRPSQPREEPESDKPQTKDIITDSADVEYEVIFDKDKNGNAGYEYERDSSLRDDLYVGKDGNLYLKDGTTGGSDHSHKQNSHNTDNFPHDYGSRPSNNRPSKNRRPRPFNPHPSAPRGRFEDEANEYDDRYKHLLKNHNMGQDCVCDDKDELFIDISDDSYEYSNQESQNGDDYFNPPPQDDIRAPQRPYRGQTHNFLRYLYNPNSPRTNYPSYFHDARQVLLPGFRFLPRVRRPLYPPRARSPFPPARSNRRPLFPYQGYRLPARPSNPRPSLQKPINNLNNPENNPNSQDPSLRPRPTFTFKEEESGLSKGFYPGNGFFSSDFETMFQMSPSNRHRIERLPTPQGLNETVVSE